jgi:tRNA splicing endonuclease
MFLFAAAHRDWNKGGALAEVHPAELPLHSTGLKCLRRDVFADLWERGFYLTDGFKFGADFLAYPGDPNK